MLEIIVLISLASKIKQLAEERNERSLTWTLRLIGTWIGIEIIIIAIGLMFVPEINQSTLLLVAIPALIAAYLGSNFLVVKRLENIPTYTDESNENQFQEGEKPNLDHFR